MRIDLPLSLASTLALALAVAAAPAPVNAQQASSDQDACTMTFTPANVDAGGAAVQVSAQFSKPVGHVSDLKAPDGAGIALTSPKRLQRMQMSNNQKQGAQPQPIEMARDLNSATLWLNLVKAQSGDQKITVTGENGTCTGTLTVNAPSPK